MPGPKVFVSYSRRNEKALEQLQRFLRPLERDGLVTVWADTRQKGGDDWEKEIDQTLAEATVALLLISQDFLNSKYTTEEEVPRVLEREAAGRMKILPVFLSPLSWGISGSPIRAPASVARSFSPDSRDTGPRTSRFLNASGLSLRLTRSMNAGTPPWWRCRIDVTLTVSSREAKVERRAGYDHQEAE